MNRTVYTGRDAVTSCHLPVDTLQ